MAWYDTMWYPISLDPFPSIDCVPNSVLNAHLMLTQCSPNPHPMLTQCSPNPHLMLTQSSPNAHSPLHSIWNSPSSLLILFELLPPARLFYPMTRPWLDTPLATQCNQVKSNPVQSSPVQFNWSPVKAISTFEIPIATVCDRSPTFIAIPLVFAYLPVPLTCSNTLPFVDCTLWPRKNAINFWPPWSHSIPLTIVPYIIIARSRYWFFDNFVASTSPLLCFDADHHIAMWTTSSALYGFPFHGYGLPPSSCFCFYFGSVGNGKGPCALSSLITDLWSTPSLKSNK